MESRRRSIAKAMSWRVIATLVTFVIAYLITKEAILSLSIGFGDAIVKIGAFYSHERLWNRISFGKKRVKEDYTI